VTLFNGTLPAFDFGEGGIAVALVRGLFLAALFSTYGTLLYRARLAPATLKKLSPKQGADLNHRFQPLTIGSLLATLGLGTLWLVFQAHSLFESHSVGALGQAVVSTAVSTSFGQILIMQAVCIVWAIVCTALARYNALLRDFAMGGAGFAVLLQVGHDHAASMYDGPSLLMVVEIGHLLAGAAWLGSLVPLLLTIRTVPASLALAASRRYSKFGTVCVAILVLTALYQGWQLVGSFAGLIGTAYGWLAISKIMLFSILLALAASNRYQLTPALTVSGDASAKSRLTRSIALETCLGLAILTAASLLVNLPPSIHEQVVWPFAERPSLATIQEDPDFRNEVIFALLGIAAAIGVAAAGLYYKRWRWPALGIALVALWFSVPSLDLLFVEAYPTSFYHSTTAFAATSIARGAALYPTNCAACHGAEGRGDGPLASTLPEPPADLTAEHLWAHSDGELFWWLTDGIKSPEGEPAMPGFAATLTEEERWNLIDFIRARNAGLRHAETASWSPNIQAPKFQAQCSSGTLTSDDLHGMVIRLVFGNAMPPPPTESNIADQLITVLATPATVPVKGSQCLAQDPSLVAAYSLVAGIAPDQLAGTEFLIDANGWLRAVQKPGQTISWNDPGQLSTLVTEICTHPLAESSSGHSHHH
jgi:putative copper export protein/mono/diheme cytochrome c family protein